MKEINEKRIIEIEDMYFDGLITRDECKEMVIAELTDTVLDNRK